MDNKLWDNTHIPHPSFAGELIIIRGIPGSGKSTLAKKLVNYDAMRVHVETDMFFNRRGLYQFDLEQLGRAHNWCLTTVETLLHTRGNVIVSNTFTQYKEMKDYVEFAMDFGYGIEVYTMRNEFGNIHGVPEETMTRMRNRFESHESIIEKIRGNQSH